MKRESKKNKQERALEICGRMDKHYPSAQCALNYGGDPFKLCIAVMLSAQTTDKGVNKVTPILWKRYPTIADLACASVDDVAEIIHSIGFYHNKAANCINIAQMVLSDFDGELPHSMSQLQKLPGVGRKTANVILNEAFNVVCGIAVDTHVFRISHKLCLSKAKTAKETEEDLLALLPKDKWKPINHQWVLFGREICLSRNPKCATCFIADLCPSACK